MSIGIASLGLSLEKLGLTRSDSESATPEDIDVRSGLLAPVYEQGPQTRIRREPLRGMATLSWSGGPDKVYGGIENVSPNGCLIRTEASLEDGTEVEFRIAAVGLDRDLEVEGTGVVRHETEVDGRRAYGIEFTVVEDETALKRLYNLAAG